MKGRTSRTRNDQSRDTRSEFPANSDWLVDPVRRVSRDKSFVPSLFPPPSPAPRSPFLARSPCLPRACLLLIVVAVVVSRETRYVRAFVLVGCPSLGSNSSMSWRASSAPPCRQLSAPSSSLALRIGVCLALPVSAPVRLILVQPVVFLVLHGLLHGFGSGLSWLGLKQ
ncbi:unnamed protein product [Peniophora sp. CBMAI 1063]|nr:unnamed protein product [Peniophora sp. CBMAI 1063]